MLATLRAVVERMIAACQEASAQAVEGKEEPIVVDMEEVVVVIASHLFAALLAALVIDSKVVQVNYFAYYSPESL